MKKNNYIHILFGCLFIIFIFLLIILNGNIYGSTLDFESQHFFIPDYFRKLFYNTFDLFPDFAFNLGSGQNIYYFAYYGFLSPIIIISYLLPFIKMLDYIIISNIILLMVSSYLIYKFIKNNDYSDNIAFFGMFIYLCATPIIFHTHRHIMFVNYMPFLILSLINIDNYFKTKKRFNLAISFALVIFTSYFFSFSSLFILIIYGIYKYLSLNKFNIKSVFKEGFKFILPLGISIFTAGILLLPVIYTLLNGRDAKTSIDLLSLLIPKFDFNYLLYGSYTCGLTGVSLLALFNSLQRKSKYRLLSIFILIILIFPIFNYLLNGTLYLNGKAFIPLIPLIVLIICDLLESKNINILLTILMFIILFINNIIYKNTNSLVYIDLLITIIYILLAKKIKIVEYIIIPVLITISIFNNLNDTFMKKDIYLDKLNSNINSLIEEINKNDKEFYRIGVKINTLKNINNIYNIDYYNTTLYSSTFNKTYNKFYYDTFNNNIEYRNRSITSLTNHFLFNNYMGIKYIITDNDLNDNYVLIKELDGIKVYKSNDYYSIGYVTDNITSIEDYNKEAYPYNIYSLVNSVVIDKESNINNEVNIIKLDYVVLEKDFDYEKNNNVYKINLNKEGHMKIKINNLDNEVLFIRFNNLYAMPCSKNDTYITINGNINKLTCKSWKYHNGNYTFDYLIDNNILNITLSKGKYELTDFQFYTLEKNKLYSDIDRFIIDRNNTFGDIISGHINVNKSGYFILQIPYDKGFAIKVNNKIVDYYNVNDGLIGFNINKGNNNILIEYHAPYKNYGIICSIIGLLGLIYLKIKDGRNGKNISNSTLFE